jgi:hypothetical protein
MVDPPLPRLRRTGGAEGSPSPYPLPRRTRGREGYYLGGVVPSVEIETLSYRRVVPTGLGRPGAVTGFSAP